MTEFDRRMNFWFSRLFGLMFLAVLYVLIESAIKGKTKTIIISAIFTGITLSFHIGLYPERYAFVRRFFKNVSTLVRI